MTSLGLCNHIVAPFERKEDVLTEIKRPVFERLHSSPLRESCTYLSYDSIRKIASQEDITHMRDSLLDKHAEEATDDL